MRVAMAFSGKELQRRWRERQKAINKKHVSVVLSRPAYESLNRLKKLTGHSLSVIIAEAVQAFSRNSNPHNTKHDRNEEKSINDHPIHEFPASFAHDPKEDQNQHRHKISDPIQLKKSLDETEDRLQFILNNSHDVVWWGYLDKDTFEYMSPSSKIILGYAPEEMKALGYRAQWDLIHPDDYKAAKKNIATFKPVVPGEPSPSIEYRMKHKTRGYRWMSHTRTILFDEKQNPFAVVGNVRDIHEQKLAELELQKLREELESKVAERTRSLEETNTALRLMLKKEEEVKNELEEKIASNVKELIFPYLEKLKMSRLANSQEKFIGIIESNLNQIVSPFLRTLTSKFLALTPREIQVANLVRHGKTTKEIAGLLNTSVRTIEFHRANIRKKIGIKNKKMSLRAILLSFE